MGGHRPKPIHLGWLSVNVGGPQLEMVGPEDFGSHLGR
jgi:hypothetical protein